MPRRDRKSSIVIAAALVFLSLLAIARTVDAQSGKMPPKAALSVPDLTGVWQVDRFQPALFPKGTTPPLTAWGAELFKQADTLVNDPNLACLPHGIPRLMFVPLPMQIWQVPETVLIYQEAGNQLRQIHMNRGHKDDLDPTYNGDSVGKWEGDTLVVDSIGFNDVTWLDHVGLPHSESLHVVERIRRVDHDTLVDNVTVEDPKAYTKPWTASQTYHLKPGWEIAEYVCDHNKYVYHAK